MSNANRKKVKSSPFKRRFGLAVMIVILILVLLFLLLFKVDNVVVTGNKRYTEQQIKDLCIDENGFNNTVIYYLTHRKIETPDVPLLEYVDTIYVDRNTIRLHAHENLTIGMFQVGDKVCCIDQEGVVIEILDAEGSENLNLPLISDLGSKGTVGEKIDIDDAKLNALSALMNCFEKYGIMPQNIDVVPSDDEENPVYTYELTFGGVKVNMGPDENLEEKMRRVAAIVPKLEGKTGLLHMENFDENTERIIFDSNAVQS